MTQALWRYSHQSQGISASTCSRARSTQVASFILPTNSMNSSQRLGAIADRSGKTTHAVKGSRS